MDFIGHLRGLLRFKGRERRTTFWLWVLVSYGIQTGVGLLAMLPLIARMMTLGPRVAAAAEQGDPPPLDLFPIGWFAGLAALSMATFTLLLGAAVVRRLHDSGRSGWWAMLPLPFQLATLALIPVLFAQFDRVPADSGFPTSFLWLFVNNLFGFAALIVLVVFCAMPTEERVNRFGPPPGEQVG